MEMTDSYRDIADSVGPLAAEMALISHETIRVGEQQIDEQEG